MRESVGALWVTSICLTFTILFVAYIAISVNYSKAFLIKSRIVSMVEENEGLVENGDTTFLNGLNAYLSSQNYTGSGACPDTFRDKDGKTWQVVLRYNRPSGIRTNNKETIQGTNLADNCMVGIYRRNVELKTGYKPVCAPATQYRVMTFFNIDVPVISIFTNFRVRGDTSTIYDFQNATCGKNGADIRG